MIYVDTYAGIWTGVFNDESYDRGCENIQIHVALRNLHIIFPTLIITNSIIHTIQVQVQ